MEYLIRARGIYRDERLQDVTGLRVREGRIAELAPYEALAAHHPDLTTLDLSDCWLFPGLINTHVHREFAATNRARLA